MEVTCEAKKKPPRRPYWCAPWTSQTGTRRLF